MKNKSTLTYLFTLVAAVAVTVITGAQEYSTCKTWQEVVEGKNHRYAPLVRVLDPGTSDRPAYTGFWFYDVLQFDVSGRYALAMKVYGHLRNQHSQEMAKKVKF